MHKTFQVVNETKGTERHLTDSDKDRQNDKQQTRKCHTTLILIYNVIITQSNISMSILCSDKELYK